MNSPAPKTMAMTNNSLSAQLRQIGLCALPTQLDDFIANATKSRWSVCQILEQVVKTEAAERSRRSLDRRLTQNPKEILTIQTAGAVMKFRANEYMDALKEFKG
jgi:hypothetical protein